MNIGLFTDVYYPQVCGVSTSIKLLKEELERRGHRVYVITVKSKEAKKSTEDVIRITSVPFLPAPEHRIGSLYSLSAYQKIKKLQLDLIHTHTEFSIGLFGRMIAKRFNIPVVHTYHTMYEDYVHYIAKSVATNPSKRVVRNYVKLFCRSVDYVIAPSEKTKAKLISYGVVNGISIIPTGIDVLKFKSAYEDPTVRSTIREKYGVLPEDKVVLFVGRMAKEKSIHLILDAFDQLAHALKEAKLIIVGDGPEAEKLREHAQTLIKKDRILFTGAVNYDVIPEMYQLGDCFVSTSITETQGLTIIEAMAAGLAIVARYDKNLESLMRHEYNGLLVYDIKQLPTELYRALHNENQSKKLVENALLDSYDLSLEKFGLEVEQLYHYVIRKRRLKKKKSKLKIWAKKDPH
jgi:1,2-diacylglycerol 3-alpha-glucosyltransferase